MIEVEVNGTIVEFPDGTPPEVMQQALAQQFGGPTEQPAPAPAPQATPEADALESMMGLPGEMGQTLGEGWEQYGQRRAAAGPQDPMGETNTALSQMARTGGELMWDVGKVGADAWMATWGQLLPQALKDSTKEGIREFSEWVSQSRPAQAAWKAVNAGAEAWDKFKAENPRDAEQFASVVDEAFMMSPRAPLHKLGVDGPTPFHQAGAQATAAGTRQTQEIRRAGVKKMLDPDTRVGPGRTTIEGWRGEKVYNPTEFQDEIIDAANDVPGIDPQLTYVENYNAIDDHIGQLSEDLLAQIDELGNPQVDRAGLVGELQNIVERLPEMDEALTLSGDAQGVARRILRKAENLINNSDGSVRGILEARQELDQWVREYTKGAFDSQTNNATQTALRIIRTRLNGVVADAVPDAAVSDTLRNQHLLYKSLEELEPKTANEAHSTLSRLYQNAHRATGISVPTTPLAQWATAGYAAALTGAVAASPVIGPLAGATLAGGGAAVALAKWLKSPRIKNQVGTLLKTVDKAINETSDPSLIAQLRADRAALLALIEEPENYVERESGNN